MNPRHERGREAFGFGLRAETLAVWLLRLKGYRLLGRRLRTPAGELDIVARRGAIVAFVEVKGRGDPETALRALTDRQRHRLERAAEAFLAQRADLASLLPRFDLMVVGRGGLPRHLADAWRPRR